jgi:beta-phosphoglucomutase-like phosphatase (HAD superfamily)
VTWLIYDSDGVLVDSELLAGAALAELMSRLGHPITGTECIRVFGGLNVGDALAKAEQILGHPVPPDVGEEAAQRLLGRFRSELQPVNGVTATIASLPYRRCVCSSSAPDRLRLSLEVTGLAPLFGNMSTAQRKSRTESLLPISSCLPRERAPRRRCAFEGTRPATTDRYILAAGGLVVSDDARTGREHALFG